MTPAASHGWRRAVRRIIAAGLLLLLAVAVWTGWALLRSRGEVEQARAALTAAQSDGSREQTSSRLARARQDLERVDRRLSAPGPALAAELPWAGRTPEGARISTRAVLAAVIAAQRLLSATSDGPPLVADGRIDPRRLAAVADVLRRSARDVQGPVTRLDELRTGMTPGQIRRGVLQAREQLDGLPARLSSAADALDALGGITGARGPRRLLVVLENNAELRGTGGIVTVFAEATARDGAIELGKFRDVDEVADRAPAVTRVAAPPDYRRLWGQFLADSTLWKNTNMSPDIATSSAVLARVAAATLGRAPDAVLWLDVRTLADIIGATSPARLPDGTLLTKESTVRSLLSGSYRTAVDTRAGQAARRARLRAAADAVAARLFDGTPDASRLSLALNGAAKGRHLALWSADESEQRALAAASLAGEIRATEKGRAGDIVSVAVQNFGGGDRDGNKLDIYARRLVSVRVRVTSDTAEVEQEVSLRNIAPTKGLPVYVAGGATPGVSNNYLTFAVPATATLTSFTRAGQPVRTDVLREGDHRVVTDAISLPPGTTATWLLRYRMPLQADGTYTLRAYPQPLAVDAGLSVDITGANRRLRSPAGRVGDVRVAGPFTEQQTLTVGPPRDGVLRRAADAVRRFWSEPVRLPF